MAFYSDAKAIDVVANKDIKKDQLVVLEGFHGIAQTDAVSGEELAIEIALREHTAVVPAGLAVAKGALLYMTPAGAFATTSNSGANRLVAKATAAKNSKNVVIFVLLPQSA